MTNEIKRNEIKTLIEKVSQKHGGYDDVTLIGVTDAWKSNNAQYDNCWEQDAVKSDGLRLVVGRVIWSFERDLEDTVDQNWDFDTDEFQGFHDDDELDLDDEDDLDEAIELLRGALK